MKKKILMTWKMVNIICENALEGVPGAAGAELDETQLCSSKYEIRSHGEILLIFFTLLLVKFIAT